MKHIRSLLFLLAAIFSACSPATTAAPDPTATPSGPRKLTIMTHASFAISDPVKAAFEQQYNAQVEILRAGDAGEELNKAILAKGQPLADVYYGIDNTLLSRALAEDIFEPYNAPGLAQIPAEFKLDSTNRALPVDYGDVCLNFDVDFFKSKNLPPPASLEDLLLPEYKDLLVVQNPATSSPGLAFLLTTIAHFGADNYLTYWQGLVDNGVKVVNSWEVAYYTEYTRAGGARPIVVSYSSSPAFELLYANPPLSEPPTAAVTAPGTCFRQIEFVGILKGTTNIDLAQKWVDFMLSPAFQADMPLQMFVFPVLPGVTLEEAFTKFLVNPTQTASLDPQQITTNRQVWLQAWTETVLR